VPIALITGISGQDGGYLAENLLGRGVEVHGLAREEDGQVGGLDPAEPGLTLHRGDLTDLPAVGTLIEEIAPDEVYNLAGISSVARSWADPMATAQVCGLAVAGLLESVWQSAERTRRPIRFVQASSAEIFGMPMESPQTEATRIAPVNPYGAAKAYAHHLVAVYRARGLHASSVILYNHESPRRPETFVTRKITAGAARIARGDADELVLGNLDPVRDWGWAPDYMDAMARAARAAVPDDYVVATGEGHSVREFVAAAFTAAGVTDWEKYVRMDRQFVRPVEGTVMIGDPTRTGYRLGWRPSVTFEEVVARMVAADLGQ
jgi:GDPmannose 4,6-dehydratase